MLPEITQSNLHKGDPEYALELGQNDSINDSKQKHLVLTVARRSRRKSVEDNFMVPNVKFVKPISRTKMAHAAGKRLKTERVTDNDTYNSIINTDDNSTAVDHQHHNTLPKRKSVYATNQSPIQLRNSQMGSHSSLGMAGGHRYNRSFDKSALQNPGTDYKRYVGDISQLTLPSRLDVKPSRDILQKTTQNQRYLQKVREKQENQEIGRFNDKFEIVVDNVQTHIKLILRLIKTAYQTLEDYKQESAVLRDEIFELRQQLIDENEDVLKDLHPQLLQSYKSLKKDMKSHKADNEIKYKELLKLKTGNAQVQQLIDNEVNNVEEIEMFIKGATDGYESEHNQFDDIGK